MAQLEMHAKVQPKTIRALHNVTKFATLLVT